MIKKYLKLRALLLALAGCSCVALSALSQPTGSVPPAIETEVPSTRPSPTTLKPQATITSSSRERQPSSTQFQVLRPNTAALTQELSSTQVTTAAPIATSTSTPTTSAAPTDKWAATERVQREAAACLHNNQTYQIGQKWNDDCMHTCECVLDQRQFEVPLAISACRPRCPSPIDPPGANCRLERSAKDACCLEWHCELEAKFAPTSPVAPTTLTTTTQTERGQLNMSTTEIRMPPPAGSSPAPAASLAASTSTTASAAPSTTTTAKPITTTALPATLMPFNSRRGSSSQPIAPVTTVRAPITTTLTPTSTNLPTTTSNVAPRRSSSQQAGLTSGAAPLSAREPRQGDFSSPAAARTPTPAPADFSSMTRALAPAPIEEAALSDIDQLEGNDAREVEPSLVDLCIVENIGYEINQIFSGKCGERCRCLFGEEARDKTRDIYIYKTINLRNDTLPAKPTEIRCGWPERCEREALAKQLAQLADCAESALVQPADQCDCPTVSCIAPRQQPARGQSLSPVSKVKKAGCKSLSNPSGKYEPGESFTDECHSICTCSSEGHTTCRPLTCPAEPPSDSLCAEWELEPSFKQNTSAALCCPDFVCKRPALKLPSTSSTSPPESSSTRQIATSTATASAAAPTTTTSTATTTTTSTSTSTSISSSSESGEEARSEPKSCSLMGKHIADGELVPAEIQERDGDENCERPVCVCKDGEIVCPPPACSPSSPSLELDRVNVTLANSTTVELLIDLPKSLIGHYGYFELNYTHAPLDSASVAPEAEPPGGAVWKQRPKIRTANEMLSADTIKYYWPDLVPGHKYWFQVSLIYQGPLRIFVSPIRSPIQSMLIPQVPSSPTMPTTSPTLDSSSASSASAGSASNMANTARTTSFSTTTSTTPKPAPTRVLQPSKPASNSRTQLKSSTTTTTSTTSTTASPSEGIEKQPLDELEQTASPACTTQRVPSSESPEEPASPNELRESAQPSALLHSWHVKMTNDVHAAIQRNAWHLLVAFFVMTALFVIVLYSYCKKVRVVASITTPGYHHNAFHHHPHHNQSAYDNPTFTKLVSYYANQPHVLLVDEANQNFDNMAKQKNLEVDKSSPLHNSNVASNNNGATPNHHTTSAQHRNGRQNLI